MHLGSSIYTLVATSAGNFGEVLDKREAFILVCKRAWFVA